MVIAGEASGDALATELVIALRRELLETLARPTPDTQPLHTALAPVFFGAGGPRLAAAGVDLAFDLTRHAVVGLVEVLKRLGEFRRLFQQLLDLAVARQPDIIVCVDFSGFNRRFARAVQERVRAQRRFANWLPRIVQFVSPQVWASRPGRALQMARDFDLLLSIFPFEKDWYARHAPGLRVEFVGHPLVDRFAGAPAQRDAAITPASGALVLLPGSRVGELKRHLPVMLGALARIQSARPGVGATLVLPDEGLAQLAAGMGLPAGVRTQVRGLPAALAGAALAIASTGTVTMECAFFGVPTVTLYKTSWSTYQIGRRIIRVNSLTMPNLLAGEAVFPEFIQHEATPENIARAALELLDDNARRQRIRGQLSAIIESLGPPGACRRAARLVAELALGGPPA
jgi:lipid-A-disaccharide synthase